MIIVKVAYIARRDITTMMIGWIDVRCWWYLSLGNRFLALERPLPLYSPPALSGQSTSPSDSNHHPAPVHARDIFRISNIKYQMSSNRNQLASHL